MVEGTISFGVLFGEIGVLFCISIKVNKMLSLSGSIISFFNHKQLSFLSSWVNIANHLKVSLLAAQAFRRVLCFTAKIGSNLNFLNSSEQ